MNTNIILGSYGESTAKTSPVKRTTLSLKIAFGVHTFRLLSKERCKNITRWAVRRRHATNVLVFTSNIQYEHNRVKTSDLIDPAENRFLKERPLGLSNLKNFLYW
jgi:hypothetical protein